MQGRWGDFFYFLCWSTPNLAWLWKDGDPPPPGGRLWALAEGIHTCSQNRINTLSSRHVTKRSLADWSKKWGKRVKLGQGVLRSFHVTDLKMRTASRGRLLQNACDPPTPTHLETNSARPNKRQMLSAQNQVCITESRFWGVLMGSHRDPRIVCFGNAVTKSAWKSKLKLKSIRSTAKKMTNLLKMH